jgi:hypothetical protein
MIGGTITLNATEEPARGCIVENPEINSVTRHSDLGHNSNSAAREFRQYVSLKG